MLIILSDLVNVDKNVVDALKSFRLTIHDGIEYHIHSLNDRWYFQHNIDWVECILHWQERKHFYDIQLFR